MQKDNAAHAIIFKAQKITHFFSVNEKKSEKVNNSKLQILFLSKK